jgi:hypothetical protein
MGCERALGYPRKDFEQKIWGGENEFIRSSDAFINHKPVGGPKHPQEHAEKVLKKPY